MSVQQSPTFRLIAPVIPYRGSSDDRSIDRALSSLIRLDQIRAGEDHDLRESKRFLYNTKQLIVFPAISDPAEDYPPVQVACTAWTRNLSSSGISIVVPSSLTPVAGIDDTVTCIDLNHIALEGSKALVGLVGPDSKANWIESHIVRARGLSRLGTSALELGLRFEAEHSQQWPDADRLERLVGELRSGY